MLRPWITARRTTVLDRGNFLRVEDHRVVLPDGREIDPWPWLVMPDYVNVAAVTREGKFLCFRQTKYAVEGLTLAPVGGYLEPGEQPLAAAQRELLEETGYRADDWRLLGSYVADGNRGGGTAHLWLALRAEYVQAPAADDLEDHELLTLPREDVEKALREGQFKVLGWMAVMACALLDDARHRSIV
jgi:ADP-ribose pyrophosphatase